MHCPNCGTESSTSARFCMECGEPYSERCVGCKAELPDAARFCPECGTPIAHEDHAQRACFAALQVRDDLLEYARELKRDKGLRFSTRIGIHSGVVVVGKVGASGHAARAAELLGGA